MCVATWLAVAVAGCAEDGASGQDVSTNVPQPPPNQVDATVSVTGDTVSAGVKSSDPNQTVTLPPDVTATLEGPPGTPPVDLTKHLKVDGDRGVRIEPFDVKAPGRYEIALGGANGAITFGNKAQSRTTLGTQAFGDPSTETTLTLGTFRLGFEKLPDGTLLVPSSASFVLPTSGSTAGSSITLGGLPSGSRVTVELRTVTGTVLRKSQTVPAGSRSVTISDVGEGIAVASIDGPKSSLAIVISAQ
jgi:hypothetical protein